MIVSPTDSVEEQSSLLISLYGKKLTRLRSGENFDVYDIDGRTVTILEGDIASEIRKARLDELRVLSKTDWAYDEAFGGYLKERIAELEREEQ